MLKIDTSSSTAVGLVVLGMSLAYYLLQYLTNLVLTNHLSAEKYGDLSVALNVLGVLAALALLGTGASAKRFLAKYLQQRDTDHVSDFLRWNTALVSRSFLLCLSVGVVSSVLMVNLHLFEIWHIESYHLAVYMPWLAPIAAAGVLLGSYLQCSDHVVLSYSLTYTLKYLMLAVLFFLVLNVMGAPQTNLLIVGILFSALVAIPMAEILYARTREPLLIKYLRIPRGAWNMEQTREWWHVSRWLIATQMILLLTTSLDLLILETVSGRDAEVGYYGAALTIANLLWILPDGPLRPVQHRISTLLTTDRGRPELQRLLNRAVAINAVTGILTLGVIVLFANHLLSHFGPDYVAAHNTLMVVAFTALLGMISSSAIMLLAYAEQEKALMKFNILELSVLLVLGFPLAHQFGMIGVAVATLVAVLLKNVFATIHVRRNLGLRPVGIV